LLHGDAKAANFFFRRARVAAGGVDGGSVGVGGGGGDGGDGGVVGDDTARPDVGVIDWQWTGWGHPATDVAYCLATSAASACLSVDGASEAAWLRHYHAALVDALVGGGVAADAASAAALLPLPDLTAAYEAALLDVAVLVVSYHWHRIAASPAVLAARAGMTGSNAYNKSVWHARWLVARTAVLLDRRGVDGAA